MHLISHRGNISGPYPKNENTFQYIETALSEGYEVEIDVWSLNDKLYLGHDEPLYEVLIDYLENERLWCHCKNIDALNQLINRKTNCFFHQNDDATLTSKNFIWTYPERQLFQSSICVLPESGYIGNLEDCAGICSDYIENYIHLI